MDHVRQAHRVLGQPRINQRYRATAAAEKAPLTAAIMRLATQYGRYGYRRITVLPRAEGWSVNTKRVERIWRREGLTVPRRQPKRARLWLNDGFCIRLRPGWHHHVWATTLSRLGPTTGGCSAWENGYNESLTGKLRDEMLNGDNF